MLKNKNTLHSLFVSECPENAPWLLIVPGVSGGVFMFEEAVKFFEKDYRIVLFNNPGIGGAKMMWDMTVDKLAQTFLDVMSDLGIEQANAIGHSMGGMTLQTMALAQPQKFSKLVFVSTSYGGPFTENDVERLSEHLRCKAKKLSPKKWRSEAMKEVFSSDFIQNNEEKLLNYIDFYEQKTGSDAVRARHFLCGAHFSSFGRVHLLPHKSLVVHGKEDHLISFAGGEKLAEQLPNARLWAIDNCGHMPFVEKTDFYPTLYDFLSGKLVGCEVVHGVPPRIEQTSTRSNITNLIQNLMRGLSR